MADRKITIDIESRKSGTGTADAKKEIDGLAFGAGKAGASVSEAFKKMQASVGRVTGAVGALRNIFTGFGIGAALVSIIGRFKAMRDAIDEARQAQKDLAEGLAAIKAEMADGFTAKTVDDLTEALRRANDEIERLEARRKAEADARRTAEDAASGLSEQRELSAIDPSDPLAAQKAGEIRAKYASARGTSAAERRLEDTVEKSRQLESRRSKLLDEASIADQHASMLAKDADLERAKADAATTKGNELVMPPWWKLWALPEPDPKLQLSAAQEAQGFTAQAGKLDSASAAAAASAASKRADADLILDLLAQMAAERGAAYQGVERAQVEGSAGRRSAAASTEAARQGIIARRSAAASESAADLADRVAHEEAALQLRNERDWAAGEVGAARSGYNAAAARRTRPRSSDSLVGRWGSDGRLRTADDLASEAEAAAASAERTVSAAAARLRAAKANFDRLETALKNQRDGD